MMQAPSNHHWNQDTLTEENYKPRSKHDSIQNAYKTEDSLQN